MVDLALSRHGMVPRLRPLFLAVDSGLETGLQLLVSFRWPWIGLSSVGFWGNFQRGDVLQKLPGPVLLAAIVKIAIVDSRESVVLWSKIAKPEGSK